MMRNLSILLLLLTGMAQAQISDFGEPDFQRADSIAALYKGEGLESLPLLAHKLTDPLSSELEQFRAIYTWVCTNIGYDYGFYLKNKRKRKQYQEDGPALDFWNAYFRAEVFEKLRKKQKTVCTGYAYLLSELASLADINCIIIDGYGRTVGANIGEPGIPNHSWNAVQLNSKWYLCDPTWSSGSMSLQEKGFVEEYHDGYFLADPASFALSHYPLDTIWLLMDRPPTLTSFLHAPLIYNRAFFYQLFPIRPQNLKLKVAKNDQIIFLFKAPDAIDTNGITMEFTFGQKSQKVNPEITRSEKGLLEIKHIFNGRGKYGVHIKMYEDYIASYTVNVGSKKRDTAR